MNKKKNNLATAAVVTAIPVKPNTAAMIEITKKTRAQYNMALSPCFSS